ncbi:O-antigen ligase family protein [Robertmurraya korlensis]|uniref:O-antigen ligase family protein n=1 Tax=Robertmurraya korlensis TaxID=519977 RepID=UPI00203D8903|nr:O-antigen ligase family protein [Robertmurraya korlensis]MCM3602230.1 O-antigen ligase family protein [Robertmurraya korlensis]
MKVLILLILYLSLFFISAKYLKMKNDEKDNLIILLTILFALSFNLSLGFEQFLDDEHSVGRVHSGFIAIVACFVIFFNKRMFQLRKEWIFILPLFIISLYDLFFRVDDYVRFLTITHTYISILLLYLIFKGIDKFDINRILNGFNYLAIFNGILSIAQYVTGKKLLLGNFNDSIIYTEGLVVTKRAVGLAGTNNSAGTFAALLVAVTLYNVAKRKDKLSIISLVLTLIAAILTLTRSAYGAILVELMIFIAVIIYKNRDKFYRYIKFVVIGTILVVLGLFFSRNLIYQKLFLERGDTTSSRFTQYERTFNNIVPDHFLFGIGSGQYRTYLLKHFSIRDIDIHSQYLNVLVESGFIIFVLFVILNLALVIKIVTSNCDWILKTITACIFIANLMCANFTPSQYYYLNNIIYFLIMFAIYFEARKFPKETKFFGLEKS